MRPVVTADQMRRADADAIAAGMPVDALMERAGRAVARAALTVRGRRYGARAVVVCGPGNNGGDGYVAARLLREQGMRVVCLRVADPPAEGAAKSSYDRLLASGGRVSEFQSGSLGRADVIVDAIFGTGFHGEPRDAARAAIEAIVDARGGAGAPFVLSVDVPSGVGGPGAMVHSDLTLALAAEKLDTAVLGPEVSDAVEVADIGIEVPPVRTWVTEPHDMAAVGERPFTAHKWKQSVAILGGSDAVTGAAVLAARGAFRAGAGYVILATTPGAAMVARRLVPEAVVQTGDQEVLGPHAWESFKEVIDRAGAVAIGPGIGVGLEQRAFVRRALAEVEQPVVLDADGLNNVQGETQGLAERAAPLAITPHAGELARLLDRSADEIDNDRVGAAREAAERFECTVLLKGPRTLVCDPEEGLVINPTGGPELATAGTGDVLTGVTAALASAEQDSFVAAWQGAYLHGYAGSLAARRTGEVGLVAWDVAEALPEALAELAPA